MMTQTLTRTGVWKTEGEQTPAPQYQISEPAPVHEVNVGDLERVASAAGGTALFLYGLMRGTKGGLAVAVLGGSLLYRATTGYCSLYNFLGVRSNTR